MTTLIKIIVTTLLSLFLFSCNFDGVFNALDGKGEIITQEHQLENFNQLTVEKGWDVVLVSSEEPKLVVKANENLLESLKFSVRNNVLHIDSKNMIGNGTKTIEVHYSTDLGKINSQSGSEVTATSVLKQDKITLEASSGGEIELNLQVRSAKTKTSSGAEMELTGTAEILEAKASSGSDMDTEKLRVKSATAHASSGAEISLAVSEKFSAETSSGGEIIYTGEPKTKALNSGVSGEIRKK